MERTWLCRGGHASGAGWTPTAGRAGTSADWADVRDQRREPVKAGLDLLRAELTARQPELGLAAAMCVEVAHRRPQHPIFAGRVLQQVVVRSPGQSEHHEEPPARRIPADPGRRVPGYREPPGQPIENVTAIAHIKRGLPGIGLHTAA